MRRLSAVAVALVLSCGAAAAQTMSTTPTAPAMGNVSPLGIPGAGGAIGISGASSAAGPSGIGLGATELNPGGLSPAISPGCTSGISSPGMTGTSSTFDGGGISGTASVGCATTAAGAVASGTELSPPSFAGSGSSNAIPLGSTELNNVGVSPMIGVPGPATTTGGATGLSLPGTSPMSTGGSSTGY